MSRTSLSLFLLLGASALAQEPATPPTPEPARATPAQQPPVAEPETPAPAPPATEAATPTAPTETPAAPAAKPDAPAPATEVVAAPQAASNTAPKAALPRGRSVSLIPPDDADLNGLVTWYAGVRQSLARELAAAQKAGLPTEAAALLESLDTARRNVLAAYARLAPRAR